MNPEKIKTECDRCGACCSKGGPALHSQDRVLLQQKTLAFKHLVTIRKGEPVWHVDPERPRPAGSEIIKIKGKGADWTCAFYEDKTGCTIYQQRPLECFLLKCWDTADLEKAAGKNLLQRQDLLSPDNPVQAFIQAHDTRCSLDSLEKLLTEAQSDKTHRQSLLILEDLVYQDLAIRSQAVDQLQLDLDLELFYFGRPLFKVLQAFKIKMHIQPDSGKLTLS